MSFFKSVPARSLHAVRARSLHTLPKLEFSNGIPGLFSQQGLDIAWTKWQQYCLDNLNRALQDAPEYTGSGFETLNSVMVASLEHGDDRSKAVARWSSLAYSNEFFFRSLGREKRPGQTVPGTELWSSMPSATPTKILEPRPVENLLKKVDSSFSSQTSFRELVVSRGSAMFGNGFVWMIETADSPSVLNTYNWGTPQAKALEESTSNINIHHGNKITSVKPLLAISAWQHTFLHDYGFDKRAYLANVFDTIDWEFVASRS